MWQVGIHKSTATLLTVPRYEDLLKDQDNEDESKHGQFLVTTRVGWCTDMARRIGEAIATKCKDESKPVIVGNT